MAEAHKFTSLDKALEVFPDLEWRKKRGPEGKVSVWNSKEGEYVDVEKGQYIVSIANRYEVHDEEPEKAKAAEAPKKESSRDAGKSKGSEETPKAVEGSTTVAPQELASDPGPDSK